jgi:hypothetical protein
MTTAAGDALRRAMTDTLNSWISDQRENHDAREHRDEPDGEECFNAFRAGDVRTMIEQAGSDLDAKEPGIVELQMQAAFERMKADMELHRAIGDLILGDHTRRRGQQIGQVITVAAPDDKDLTADVIATTGSFAVEVTEWVKGATYKSLWTTLHKGRNDSWRWYTVDQALLHLIAQRHGEPDEHGSIVTFASRVIGFDDTRPRD